MAKKKVPAPLTLRYETVPKPDTPPPSSKTEAPPTEGEVDVNAVAESLIAEFDTLDSALILVTISDYLPHELLAALPEVRDMLSMLQASSVPDPDDPHGVGQDATTDPSLSTSVSDTTDLLERTSIAVKDFADVPEPSTSPSPPASWKEVEKKHRKGKGKSSTSGSTSSRPSRISASGNSFSKKTGDGVGSSSSGSGSRNGTGSSKSGDASSSPTDVTEEEMGLDDEMALLRSLFPKLKTAELSTALSDATNFEAAVEQLLSVDMIRNVERTGSWDEEDRLTDEEEFQEVPMKRTNSGGSIELSVPMSPSLSADSHTSRSEKRKSKPKMYSLIDTLQRIPTPSSHSASRAQSPAPLQRTYGLSGPAPNAWHALSDLSSQLAALLPPHPESHFQTYLHSPDYRSRYLAVHAALESLPDVPRPADSASERILHEMYEVSLMGEGDPRKERDLKAAMRVGGEDTFMDLIDLLEEISHWPEDTEVSERYGEGEEDQFDLANSFQSLPTPSTSSSSRSGFTSTRSSNLPERIRKPKRVVAGPEGPKFIPGAQAAASSASFPTAYDDFGTPSPASSSSNRYHSAGAMPRRQVHAKNWRRVDKPPPREIPGSSTSAYAPAAAFVHQSGSEELSVQDCLANAALERHKRETAVRNAGRYFSSHLPGGKAKNASVAGHYASVARDAGNEARSWELRAARLVVGDQVRQSGNQIDLHHMTTAEAVTVASESVASWFERSRATWGTTTGREGAFVPGKAFTIITGAGNHSVGKRGVLGPAVAGALEKEGWKVDRGETSRGYIVVKGRK